MSGCPLPLLDCPTDLFEHVKVNTGYRYGYLLSTLGFWLSAPRFKRADGGLYSRASLNCIVAGHMKDKFGPNTPNFLSKTEAQFSMLQNAVDRQLWLLRGNGVGV